MRDLIITIGECMVEFAPQEDGSFRQGFAGDTFNMAWYLRRLLPKDWRIDYVTALGDDAMSDRMVTFMERSGIGTGRIARLPGLAPGLYVISINGGERSFSYWRGQSAARRLAADPARLAQVLADAGLLILSGITLAILPEADRSTMLSALSAARAAGACVAFDPNIRPRLWSDAASMRLWVGRAAANADIVLPSFDDERSAFGDLSPDDTANRYLGSGARVVVVKNGGGEIVWREPGGSGCLQPSAVASVVDTTAAGDSFNAAFLAAYLRGQPITEAIAAAADIATRVIQSRGALVSI